MALTDYQNDAFAYLRELLRSYGLESLSDFALQQVIDGASATQFRQMLWERPEFRTRFKVIFDRRDKGLAAMSPQEVIEYETSARQMFRAAGLPPGFYDTPDDFYNFMIRDVSLTEISDRVKLAQTAVYSTDPAMRGQLQSLYGMNLSTGALTAYFLDPDKATPLLQSQLLAAETAGAAAGTGWGLLTREEAERLSGAGVTAAQAREGFGELAATSELFTPSVEEEGGRDLMAGYIPRHEQIQAQFYNNAAVQERIRRRRERRTATFQAGGSYFTGESGFAGIGPASS